MKIMHLSDLHLGKRVNEFSMIDDQRYILKQVMDIVINDKADAVIIAGDVYDRQVPPVQAVELFDAFLTGLMNMNIPVLVISGNHDSAERIAFGSDIMSTGHIYMSRAYDGKMQCVWNSIGSIPLSDRSFTFFVHSSTIVNCWRKPSIIFLSEIAFTE